MKKRNGTETPVKESWLLVGWEDATALLDAAKAPAGRTLALRILSLAQQWQGQTTHGENCQCQPCGMARRMVSAAVARGLIKVPPPYVITTKPKNRPASALSASPSTEAVKPL